MIYIAWFGILFTVIQLLVVAANLLFKTRLTKCIANDKILVSVLIPARNEENNIGNLLYDLVNQNYQNIEIIVFNDQSVDKTAQIVENYAITDKRIKLINSDSLPQSWLGKNYACHSLSQIAKGNYFLFVDADVRLKNGIISNTVAYAEKLKLGLLSIFPKQIMVSMGEKMTVPLMNFILLSLLPLPIIRITKQASLAAANGQFMLFNALNYKALLPDQTFKNNKVEDIAISQYFKKNNIVIDCITGDYSITCRMYKNYAEAVNGFSKNIVAFFGHSFMLSLLFWVLTSFGILFVIFAFSLKIILFYLFIYVLNRILVSIISQQSVVENLIYLLPQQLTFGLILFKAFTNNILKKNVWKGRVLN